MINVVIISVGIGSGNFFVVFIWFCLIVLCKDFFINGNFVIVWLIFLVCFFKWIFLVVLYFLIMVIRCLYIVDLFELLLLIMVINGGVIDCMNIFFNLNIY